MISYTHCSCHRLNNIAVVKAMSVRPTTCLQYDGYRRHVSDILHVLKKKASLTWRRGLMMLLKARRQRQSRRNSAGPHGCHAMTYSMFSSSFTKRWSIRFSTSFYSQNLIVSFSPQPVCVAYAPTMLIISPFMATFTQMILSDLRLTASRAYSFLRLFIQNNSHCNPPSLFTDAK